MSAVTTNLKINGNLLSPTNISTNNTNNNNNKYCHQQLDNEHQKLESHHIQSQSQSQQTLKAVSHCHSRLNNKLQQIQRRSLIPAATLQQQHRQHQDILSAPSPTITGTGQTKQLHTEAIIHQPSTSTVPNTRKPTDSHIIDSNSSNSNSTISGLQAGANVDDTTTTTSPQNCVLNKQTTTDQLQQQQSSCRQLHHLQSLKGLVHQQQLNVAVPPALHSIPPRYQPPPNPASQHSGILKHLRNTQRIVHHHAKQPYTYFGHSELHDSAQLCNYSKYPNEAAQHSAALYISEAESKIANHSQDLRYLQHTQQRAQPQQQQQQGQQANNNLLLQRLRNSKLQKVQQQSEQSQSQTGHNVVDTQPNKQQQQQQEMLKFVRKSEQDHPSPNASLASSGTAGGSGSGSGSAGNGSTARLTVEQNRQLQSLINELRALKEQNQHLLDDNQELRDLCCFLDDDRQKGRKLAREWQRFGRYTASVMRQEVAAYQNKLRQLDDKQQELITDNLELKELCLYLDEERAHIAANSLCANCASSTRNALRDDGDGSSSSTNNDENVAGLRSYERQLPDLHLRSTLHDQTLQYVRSLERRIQQLEEERLHANNRQNIIQQQQQQQQQLQQQQQQPEIHQLVANKTTTGMHLPSSTSAVLTESLIDPISGRPEAVVRALQVLEVREQLDRDRLEVNSDHHPAHNHGRLTMDQMDDSEKALVREMCNVVWRKLEGSPNTPTLEPL